MPKMNILSYNFIILYFYNFTNFDNYVHLWFYW